MDKKEIEKHNFAVALKKAAVANDREYACRVAQEIFDADLELEEIPLLPQMRFGVESLLMQANWAPKISESGSKPE